MADTKQTLSFPEDFLWGAGVSAHQVEGNNYNQWTVWEEANAKAKAAASAHRYRNLPSWSYISEELTAPSNYVSGLATNHYELYEKDFDLVLDMNMNTFRFSVEWSRVEPKEGAWDAKEIEHYKRYLAALKERGIEPIVTLFHYTLPVWFSEMGGFEKRRNVKYFTRFAEKIIAELGSSVTFIITINEPEVYVTESYVKGKWPPQKYSFFKSWWVVENLLYAHKQAAAAIRKQNSRYKVSIAKNSAYYYAGDDALLSRKVAQFLQFYQDDYFLMKVAKHCDFLGVNYYFANRVYGYRIHNPDVVVGDNGWDLNPAALQQTLERLHDKYKLPILVTENGLADAKDEERKWWLMHTLVAMHRAREYGVNLLGYIHWSLTDNFEWSKGRWPRFGLYAVDYETFERTPRPSAVWFGAMIKKMRNGRENG